jgi:hypothetical protein
MASQMLCCMITTKSKIHQSNLRIMASQMLCCMDSKKIRNQSIILTHFIHHGVADALLSNQRDIKKSTNRPHFILTHFIHHGVADALMHELHKNRNQSVILTHFIHHGVADALLHDLDDVPGILLCCLLAQLHLGARFSQSDQALQLPVHTEEDL